MKVSPSQIKTFMSCSLQGKYKYIDRIDRFSLGSSAHYGTSVHAGLEALHNGASVDEAIQVFKDTWHYVEPSYWNRMTSESKFKDQGPMTIS